MSTAYVDTSCLVAIAFDEPNNFGLETRQQGFSSLASSNLLEAELRSTYARVARELDPSLLYDIEWVFPTRSLAPEFQRVLSAGYLRGADLWHVATVLHFAPSPQDTYFVTFDRTQQAIVQSLGFHT